MTDAPQRYPLAWPPGRPRRKPSERRRGEFVADKKRPTIDAAVARLEDQITRLGGVYAVLSTNLELRMDGRPRLDRGRPADPGVCVYFQLKGQAVAMPCDTFTEIEQNILGIANHIDAARRIEAYGVGTAAETLQAFTALPPPGAALVPEKRPWRDVLRLRNVLDQLPAVARRAAAEAQFRDLAKMKTGNDAAMRELIEARDAMREELGGSDA